MSYTRSALITGGTLNLGYHVALTLARQHPDWLIVISSRSDRLDAATKINSLLSQKNVTFIPLDLSSPENVRSFAESWSGNKYPPIQALCLNAALQFPNETVYTPEGIEATFAITHVGHALLFHLLSPHLAPAARIVVTSSGVHDPATKSGLPDAVYTSAENLAHPPPEIANGDGRRHYANAKLANVLWTYALSKRLREKVPDRGISVNAFDPGLMPGTGLAREYSALARFLWERIMPRVIPLLRVLMGTRNIHRPEESAARLARLVEGGDGMGVEEKYFEGGREIRSSVDSYDEEKSEDLWEWTVKYCARDEEEEKRFESFT
ncbi:dehydrogenase/reductase [Nemania sp. FL0916]|nr:dehydrogenase/reductase [Nemania sp. FL0916]